MSLPKLTGTHTFSVDFTVIDVPAMFPNPAVTHRVQGQYQEKITITEVTPSTPMFQSSTTGAITPASASTFRMSNVIGLSASPLVVKGTYEVIGPTNHVSEPFSVEFNLKYPTAFLKPEIEGGTNFGDGFNFDFKNFLVYYEPVNAQIYRGTVDELTFTVSLPSSYTGQFSQLEVPEPASLTLGFAGMFAVAGAYRRARCARAVSRALLALLTAIRE